MKSILNNLRKDPSLQAGLIIYLISALLYCFTYPLYHNFRDTFTPLFFIHYGLAMIYVVFLISRKELRLFQLFRGKSKPYHLLLLLLFNISAYALNQTLPIFHESVPWLTVFLVIENILLLFYLLKPSHSKASASLLLFAFTLALLINIYQLLIISPYLAVGFIASPFLGISLHVLVPLGFVIAFLYIIFELVNKERKWLPMAIAASCCFLILGYYSLQWHRINRQISEVLHEQYMPGASAELPLWVRLSQTLPDSYFTEKALQSGLIYQEYEQWDWLGGRGLQFEESKWHDPLITAAGFLTEKINLDSKTKIKILDAIFNMRHESADRFWSGKNLISSDVITNVQLFPAYRLAYTEMILQIRNESFDRQSSWFNQEEALYTFQLPEGGTVSSLSLWIEGLEAKARLTTKSKAEKAYNTIVGREVRDPSVVYWMEGNQIRVRVFPCTPEEDRKFRIGITSPLLLENKQLSYSNITFKGPAYEEARASVNIVLKDAENTLQSTLPLDKNSDGYSWKGNYKKHWSLSMETIPLAEEPFYFQGNAYSVQSISPAFTPLNASDIYLDLHKGWSRAEVKAILDIFPDKKIGLYNFNSGVLQHHRPEEILQLWDRGFVPQFSLFPFHKLRQPESSLVITRGNIATPNLSDIGEAKFSEDLFSRLGCTSPVKVFDLQKEPSNYIRSLNEFRVLQYAHGSTKELAECIQSAKFPLVPVQEDAIAIGPAGIMISRRPAMEAGSAAPDHLLRLFSYNQVLKNIGRNYFNKDFLNDEIIKEAALGNVVSPISSLIVLETLEDYKRFDIDENKDSLGNASINASGAVPEPHEWALIIIGALFLSWLWFFKGKTRFSI